ncbi:citrate lyase ligase [Photobacterium toruni]|uniref:citrate lyase ligase n=1 Tax=Photobacterium toruni TaxID=1935446 RepID=UPI002110A8EB|nr:citrate lyase ligase [Photobacterium toruni]
MHGKFKFKFRIFKYNFEKKFANEKRLIYICTRLVKFYVRNGDIDNAIKNAEFLYANSGKLDWYFILKNLYIINNEFDKADSLINDNLSYSDDLISSINIMDEALFTIDKVSFIKKYVESKGAMVSLIYVANKGNALNNKSKTELELLNNIEIYIKDRSQWCRDNTPPQYITQLYNPSERNKINQLFEVGVPIIRSTKVVLSDLDNSLVSIKNGFRTTTEQPKNTTRRVLVFGSSTTCCVGVSDDDTMVSQLQKYFNEKYGDILVENHGVYGMNLLLAMNNLVQIDIKPNDIVIFFDFNEFGEIENNNISNIDLNKIDRKNDFFIDLDKVNCHFSPRGNYVIANEIGEKILSPLMSSRSKDVIDTQLIKFNKILENFKYFLFKQTASVFESCEMKSYLSLLNDHVPDDNLMVGSVAVNCNPITKGHLHLLEYASKSVDKLFIFVIEEDKSFFSFEDRLYLVTESTKHLKNVTVLRGGKFICTELTYPDYFDKDTTETKTDASMEAWFFCEYIAKKLKINKIFLGDEPKCMITRQYNEQMQELLPNYDIEVEIIDRISKNGDVISASQVRRLLKVGDFDGIAAIVPEATLLFLKENYLAKNT